MWLKLAAMFTGLVEETGKVVSFEERGEAWRLMLEVGKVADDLGIGDSLACDGCCLTVVDIDGKRLGFDLLEETVRLTGFRQLEPGRLVNLERSLAAGARLGGHFVSGHIDAAGRIATFEERGKNYYLRVEPPEGFMKYLVYKGSVSIDGISLTVAEVDATGFAAWLIPHTIEVTNLREKKAGEVVNLEFDLLAKYVERILTGNRPLVPGEGDETWMI